MPQLPPTCPNRTPCRFTDRHVKSSIQVPNGQTVLLAGLIQEEQDKTRAGIPVLDQIPILGEAFANNNNSSVTRTELIIFIRPWSSATAWMLPTSPRSFVPKCAATKLARRTRRAP